MSAQPFGSPLFRAFDSNGAPLSGGLLYTYAGGTSTPQATYTDATGTVANANPVVLDSTGAAQVWMAPGVLYKFTLQNSLGVQQWSVDNYPSPTSTATGNSAAAVGDPGGRLTYNSGTSVPTSDLTGQTVLWYVIHKSDFVPLYSGTSWNLYNIGAGIGQALTDTLKSPAAAVANSNYDLFVWLDGAIPRLSRGPPWTSDTARGTGAGTTQLAQQNGRWVNAQNITNGPSGFLGLYVGTIRTDGSAQGNDSLAKRHCWNAYNRVTRPMSVPGSGSWAYSTSTIRQANGSTSNQLDYVVGLAEDEVTAQTSVFLSSTSGGGSGVSGVGVDSTTAVSGFTSLGLVAATSYTIPLTAIYRGIPGLGRHYLAWLEYAASGAAVQWTASGAFPGNGGISGEVRG